MAGIAVEIPAKVGIGAGDGSGDGAPVVHRALATRRQRPRASTAVSDPYRAVHSAVPGHRDCLMRAVRSCTRLNASRSTVRRLEILSLAWMTVEWSRPPNL